MNDSQLLRRYIDLGDDAAFTELVGRHINLVHSAAIRHVGGKHHLAEDVTQAVFCALARQAGSLSRHESLSGWLYTTAHYISANLLRTERRRQIREEGAHAMNEIALTDRPDDWSQLRPLLDGVMLELNASDRQTVLWRFFDAQPLAAVGRMLGVSEGAARKRVDRALERMRRALGRRGVDSSSAALAAILTANSVAAAPPGLAESVSRGALAAAASAGPPWRFLANVRRAIGGPTALWIAGVLGIAAAGAAAFELCAAHRALAALARDQGDLETDQGELKTLLRHDGAQALGRTQSSKIRDPQADFRKFLAAYPEVRARLVKDNELFAARLYGSFFRAAALSPAQIEQVEEALGVSWLGQEVITPEKFALIGDPWIPEAKIRAIVGDRIYQQFQEQMPLARANYWATKIAGHVSAAAALSGDQVDGLAAILARNTRSDLEGEATLASVDWDAVRAQAKILLPAPQWTEAQIELTAMQVEGAKRQAAPPNFSTTNP